MRNESLPCVDHLTHHFSWHIVEFLEMRESRLEVEMAASPIEDLQKARLALVELRRREAAKIAEGGELPIYAAGLFNTMNWIGAVDKAIEDEKKLSSGARLARSARQIRKPAHT